MNLPQELVSGDFISFVHKKMQEADGASIRYTFSGSIYFERMKELGLYSTDKVQIRDRVIQAGLMNIYGKCLLKAGVDYIAK